MISDRDLCAADCVDLIVVDGPADGVEVIQTSNTAVVYTSENVDCHYVPEL